MILLRAAGDQDNETSVMFVSSSAAPLPLPPQSGVRLRVMPTPSESSNDVPVGSAAEAQLCYGSLVAEDLFLSLSEAAQAGDANATRRLLEALATPLLGVVRAVMGRHSADVEDVLQESLIAVMRALPGFRGESSLLHFARTIALRRALHHRRSRSRRGPEVALDDDLRDAGQSPMDSSLARKRRDTFRLLLEELNEDQAETLAQRVLFGFSIEEIATTGGIPIGTVKSRLRLAKAALKHRIEGDPLLLELLEMDDDDAR